MPFGYDDNDSTGVKGINTSSGNSVDINSVDDSGVERLLVDAKLSGNGGVPVTPGSSVHHGVTFLVDGSSSNSMDVDGSTTPVVFSSGPPSGTDWYVYEMRIYMSDSDMRRRNRFGNISSVSNGLLYNTSISSTTRQIVNILSNSEMATLFNHEFNQDDKDGLANEDAAFVGRLTFSVPIKLSGTSGDTISSTVRDNLGGLNQLHTTISYWEEI